MRVLIGIVFEIALDLEVEMVIGVVARNVFQKLPWDEDGSGCLCCFWDLSAGLGGLDGGLNPFSCFYRKMVRGRVSSYTLLADGKG